MRYVVRTALHLSLESLYGARLASTSPNEDLLHN